MRRPSARRGCVCLLAVAWATACAVDSPAGDVEAIGAADPLPATFSSSPGTASWTPWPQALHDARHSGAATVSGPREGTIRWRRMLEGNVTPGPVVAADGTIYAASNAGVLHALDPATGEDVWTFDGGSAYGIDLSTSPAVLPDGLVLWPGPASTLYAVTEEGEEAWRLRLDGLVTSPAVLADGTVAVADDTGRVLLLRPDADAPGTVWELDLAEGSYGSPVFSPDGTTVYQSVLSGVVALRAEDGRIAWRSTAPSEIVEVSPAVGLDGTVVIGTNDPFQYGLDPGDGTPRWRYRRDFWTYSSPGVTADGIAYFGDHDNVVTGLDVTTGEPVFRYSGSRADRNPGGIGIWTSVLVDADHATYVGTRDGLVYGVDRDGALMFELRVGTTVDSYPALTGDGALVIGTVDGELLAIADG